MKPMKEEIEDRKKALERENRVLRKRLTRSEENRATLEASKDRHDALYQSVIRELDEHKELLSKNNLELNKLNRKVQHQADELSSMNSTLEEQVKEQVSEIERLARLKRFLAPAIAELIMDSGDDSLLNSHRNFIASIYCDLRGFTSFSESNEPEEVIEVLQTYHEQMGRLISRYGATIDHRAGDGVMLFFNDPVPCDQPVLSAVRQALDMRHEFSKLNENWKKLDYELGLGIGIAAGYATMGVVGFEGRYDYTANGNVLNLTARLCDEAKDGQILISQKALVKIEPHVNVEPVGTLKLKGVAKPVETFNVVDLVE
jgi:class 3 adenylate cyclase